MARVTVEDCIEQVSNRFDLVMLAAQRAREIAAGGEPTVDRDNDKNPVIALREIAGVTVTPEILEQSLVQGLQKRADLDEFEEEEDLDMIEGGLLLQPEAAIAVVPDPVPESVEAAEAEAATDEPDETAGESAETADEPDETAGESAEAAGEPDETDDSIGAEEDK